MTKPVVASLEQKCMLYALPLYIQLPTVHVIQLCCWLLSVPGWKRWVLQTQNLETLNTYLKLKGISWAHPAVLHLAWGFIRSSCVCVCVCIYVSGTL